MYYVDYTDKDLNYNIVKIKTMGDNSVVQFNINGKLHSLEGNVYFGLSFRVGSISITSLFLCSLGQRVVPLLVTLTRSFTSNV